MLVADMAKSVAEVRHAVGEARRGGRGIALVPTMGALHAGHLELIRQAKAGEGRSEAPDQQFVVVSIFVNPTQFGPGEDYRAYPRDLSRDVTEATRAGADVVFAPEVETMYPPGDATSVEVAGLTEGMCGPFRPGHFRGVATVVCKLLTIVQPDAAYFGKKDYQQLKVIQRMARDLHLPVEVVPVATVREADGLAMSSRNAYLSADERRAAQSLNRGLRAAQALAARGERHADALIGEVRRAIAMEETVRLEYVELRDAETLEALERLDRSAVLAVAAWVGRARLIDNVILPVG